MTWKSIIINFIMNSFSKGQGSIKETELALWSKDVIWGQYNEGQYSTYEIYFPSMMLRIVDHSADATAPWRQIRFNHLRRTVDHKWESKLSEATWARDVHIAAYWESHPDPRFSKKDRLSELKEQGRQWIQMDDELAPAIEIAYNRFMGTKHIQNNYEIDVEWQTEDQRALEDSLELIKVRSDVDRQHHAKAPNKTS